jgi:hypothetical protein
VLRAVRLSVKLKVTGQLREVSEKSVRFGLKVKVLVELENVTHYPLVVDGSVPTIEMLSMGRLVVVFMTGSSRSS